MDILPGKKTGLFILMEFAPVNTTGNYRSLKLIKYLRQAGVEPVVLTFPAGEAAAFFNAPVDTALLSDIPTGTEIYRIHCEPGDKYYSTRLRRFLTIYFNYKDNLAKRWKPFLWKEIDAIAARHKPSFIYTTLPPFSSGMLAVELAKKMNLPLIVDMRDAWAMWSYTPFATKLHFNLTLKEEEKIFSAAAAVIGVTPQLVKIFRNSHPGIEAKKFHYIPNGFDSPSGLSETTVFNTNKEKIVIGYVGSFYYSPGSREAIFSPWWKKKRHRKLQYVPVKEDWLYRSPYFFFKAMEMLFKTEPELRERVSLEFVGKKPDWFDKMVNEFGLTDRVFHHGFVSHQQSKEIQQQFDLILATSEKVQDDEHYCLPSKIFDSVGINKPIIGFVTEGIQKEFIEKSGLGMVFDPDNSSRAAEELAVLMKSGKIFYIQKDYINRFTRKQIAEDLARVVHEVTGPVNL